MVEKSNIASLLPSFYEPFRHFGARVADWLAPASDATSDAQAYRITMELPGVAEKDIDVSVHDGVVTVKGEKSDSRQEEGETWYFSERQYGAFSRSFRLPQDADGDKIEAQLKDGLLTVSVPRQEPATPKPQKVQITKG